MAALKNLYDNYKPSVTVEEDNTSAEQAETNAFLDAVMASDIMQETYRTLSEAKVVTGTIEDFRAQIWTLWFEGYDRDGTSANVVGSRYDESLSVTCFPILHFEQIFQRFRARLHGRVQGRKGLRIPQLAPLVLRGVRWQH